MGEVVRRLDRFEEMLREFGLRVVSQERYNTEQRLWENRFTELQRDLADEREARKADVKELKDNAQQRTSQTGSNIRQAVYSGLIPGVVFLLGVLFTLKGGGG
jgi:hypothetical protein